MCAPKAAMTERTNIEEAASAGDPPLGGRRILITGGGAGIGAVTARTATGLGARVAILDRDGAAARRTVAALGGENAIAVEGDVTDDAAVARALDRMAEAWGGIDDLVNNAGTYDHAPLLDLSLDRWRQVFEVNLFAAIAIANASVRRMARGGAIVNVASVLGQVAAPTRGPYCVSKAALISLTRMQAIEWAERGIRVNAIAPGYIEGEATRLLAAAGGVDPDAVRRRTPLGRYGTEQEVADGICYLLDPKRAAYVTGHVLEVNGGWTAYGFI
jgi:NAD(P)-dependent dehydrogenase (short-subunit alcohol dehydrogenase family)